MCKAITVNLSPTLEVTNKSVEKKRACSYASGCVVYIALHRITARQHGQEYYFFPRLTLGGHLHGMYLHENKKYMSNRSKAKTNVEAHMHARTCTHTNTRTQRHTRTHARTHTQPYQRGPQV